MAVVIKNNGKIEENLWSNFNSPFVYIHPPSIDWNTLYAVRQASTSTSVYFQYFDSNTGEWTDFS